MYMERSNQYDSTSTISNSTGDICRICHCEADPDNPLLSPCYCSGSLKYVHQPCLRQWLNASETRSCELCKFNFILHTKIKPLSEWRTLEMSSVERRRLLCAILFHFVAAICVIWSLFVLIDRATEEVQKGLIAWPFWTKLVVVAVGFTGGAIFMYIQCRQYLHLFARWKAHNRIILVQNAPEKPLLVPPSPPPFLFHPQYSPQVHHRIDFHLDSTNNSDDNCQVYVFDATKSKGDTNHPASATNNNNNSNQSSSNTTTSRDSSSTNSNSTINNNGANDQDVVHLKNDDIRVEEYCDEAEMPDFNKFDDKSTAGTSAVVVVPVNRFREALDLDVGFSLTTRSANPLKMPQKTELGLSKNEEELRGRSTFKSLPNLSTAQSDLRLTKSTVVDIDT